MLGCDPDIRWLSRFPYHWVTRYINNITLNTVSIGYYSYS